MIPEIRSTTDHLLAVYNSNSLKNENFNNKKRKKRLEIPSLYTSVPKIMIICYTVPEMWQVTHVIVIFHFILFFALLPSSNSPKNQKSTKMKKTPREIFILHMCTKIMTRCCTVPEIWCAMDGRTDIRRDGRTDGKWHIEVGAPPKNLELTETSVLSLTHRPICSAEKPCLKNDKSKL